MKVLLINPPTGLYVREDRCQSSVGDFAVSVIRPPMDLMMMASSLEALGCICKIKDYPVEGGGWKKFSSDFLDFGPDMLILSITTPTLKQDMSSCSVAKNLNPSIVTVAKGAHFLINDIKVMEEFNALDIIIRGECELVIKDIAVNNDRTNIDGITYRYNGRIKRNKDRMFLDNLDKLPLPSRHLVRNDLYTRPDTQEPMAVIETHRGCLGNCIFCLAAQVAGEKIRHRSVNIIVSEVEECINKYNIYNFHFKSDTFTWNKTWVLELCSGIIKRGLKINWICNSRADTLDKERLYSMKQAGCWAVGLGLESGSQKILNKIKKGITLQQSRDAVDLCRKFGIQSYAYFIIGFPWDNEKTINESIEFAIELEPDFTDFFLPYPFPGTELENIAKRYNLFDNTSEGSAYSQSMMNTFFLSKDELLKLRRKALRKFYLRHGYIFRKLSGISPKVFRNYLYYGIKMLRKI